MEHELARPVILKASSKQNEHVHKYQQGNLPAGHHILQLQRMIGNRAVGRLLQTKLEVSHPGDPYEREADEVAQRITTMPNADAQPTVTRQTISREEKKKEQSLQRELNTEEDKDEDKMRVQRVSFPAADYEAPNGVLPHADEAVSAASTSTGQPLPVNLRRKFEGVLGSDLSSVRVHTGPESADANRSISARAYTIGNDIHFNEGEYNPESSDGQHLLAHEVAHTVQQSGGNVDAARRKSEISASGR
jgi:hypothetical protein